MGELKVSVAVFVINLPPDLNTHLHKSLRAAGKKQKPFYYDFF